VDRFARLSKSAVIAVVVLTAAFTGSAEALEAKLSGQVDQMVMWADNGKINDFYVADNDNSSTRFRFTGAQDFDDVRIGFIMEFEAQRNASNTLDLPNTGDGDFEFNDRWMDAYFDTAFGKVSIGKGDGAANNTSETDLSGTAVIMYSDVNTTAGGFTFQRQDGLTSATTVGDTRNNFDGLGRNDRLRYDTPNFAGFTLATSATNGNAWELGAFYAGEFNGQRLAASAGYVNTEDRGSSEYWQFGTSASWLAPFGLNLTAAYGYSKYQGQSKQIRLLTGQSDDAQNFYVKLGWKFDINAVALEIGQTDDLELQGDESKNIGIAYVITPWGGVELYAAARLYELNRTNVSYEDLTQIMAGTRIKF
jgi:hypothetical protein